MREREKYIKQVLLRRGSTQSDQRGPVEGGRCFEIVWLGLSRLGLGHQGQPGEDPEVDGLDHHEESAHRIISDI